MTDRQTKLLQKLSDELLGRCRPAVTMGKDRTAICEIISEMLDNPLECEIFKTTRAYNKLEALIHAARRSYRLGAC